MNVPDLIGVEVLTPDGRGSIVSLFPKKVEVVLNKIKFKQKMKGTESIKGGLHYKYNYEEVEIIKGQYCFNEDRLKFQYEKFFNVDEITIE
jgi:flagellar biosynthesis regulator FlbT